MEKDFEKLKDLIKGINVAMMTTTDDSNELRSRPMATTDIKEEGVLWFFTYKDSPKTREISHHNQVNISYINSDKEQYVSVSGKAVPVTDKHKIDELWTPVLKAWFNEGKDDPNISLLRVELEKAEYWDAPTGVKKTFELAKSYATKDTYNSGDHQKLNFNS